MEQLKKKPQSTNDSNSAFSFSHWLATTAFFGHVFVMPKMLKSHLCDACGILTPFILFSYFTSLLNSSSEIKQFTLKMNAMMLLKINLRDTD